MVPLLSMKEINRIMTLGFCRRLFFGCGWTPRHRLPFWFRIELIAPGLISRDDVFQKQWILVTHGNKVSRSFIRFAFCSSVSLCCTNREQIFKLPKSSRTMVCVMSLPMPNSSAINLSVRRRSCVSIYRTFWIISGILLVDGRQERSSSSVVSSLR